MNSTGWECPKCGRCYAPFVRECEHESTKPVIPYPNTEPFTTTGQCFVCKGFHPIGRECSNWTVSS